MQYTFYAYPGTQPLPSLAEVHRLAVARLTDLADRAGIIPAEDINFGPYASDAGLPGVEESGVAAMPVFVHPGRGILTLGRSWLGAPLCENPATLEETTSHLGFGLMWKVAVWGGEHPIANLAGAAIAGAIAELTHGTVVVWSSGMSSQRPQTPEELYASWEEFVAEEADPAYELFQESGISAVTLPDIALTADQETSPEEGMYLMFLRQALFGPRKHVAAVHARQWPSTVDLLPGSARIERGVRTLDQPDLPNSGSYSVIAEDHDATYFVGTVSGVVSGVLVAAADRDTAFDRALEVQDRLPAPPVVPDDPRVPFRLWHCGSRGFVSRSRKLQVPEWNEIEHNYPVQVSNALSSLMGVDGPTGGGRLILWHGEPGTGKTTALRALAKEWESWCDMHYISDPEVLFSSPDYLEHLMSGGDDPFREDEGDSESARWRLIIAEDSDEFVRANARSASGAALGRLLNVTDGLLGQGTRVLVLLTTNEPLGELHPAVVRPGRCLAEIGFAAFPITEANRWLAAHQSGTDREMTLAELYERASQSQKISAEVEVSPSGLYL